MVSNCVQILIEHLEANSGDPDQMPQNVASDLGLHCLHMSHKKDVRLLWVKQNFEYNIVLSSLPISLNMCGSNCLSL